MLIHADARRVESTITGSTTAFKIEASAKAFTILSKNLYSDPISAFVRELICNGDDSHTRAGTPDRPLRIHLPTAFDTEFRARDFGVGISHLGIHTLYATYFESDKNNSNREIGGLGLGSKSPMAYTDQFSVKAYRDGLMSLYQVFVGTDGTPQIVDVILDAPTDEENGLEVIVPIKPGDIADVQARYFEFTQFMPVKPESNISATETSVHYTQLPPVLHTLDLPGYPGWTLDLLEPDRNYNWRGYPFTIVMGIVPYTLSETQRRALPDAFAKNGILHCPIGSFEISPSRETLSMNVKDYDTLNALFTQMQPHLHSIASEAIKTAPDAFAAAQRYLTFRNGDMFQKITAPPATFSWRGYTLPDDLAEGNQSAIDVPLPGNLKVFCASNAPIRGKPIRMENLTDFFPTGTDSYYQSIRKPDVVYWSETKRSFRHTLADTTRSGYLVWQFYGGTLEQAQRVAAMFGQTVIELPKPPKVVRDTQNPKAKNALPTNFLYETVYGPRLNAAQLAERKFGIINPDTGNGWADLEEWDRNTMRHFLKDDNDTILVTIPPAHSKIRNQLAELQAWSSWDEFTADAIDMDAVLASELRHYRFALWHQLKFPRQLEHTLCAYAHNMRVDKGQKHRRLMAPALQEMMDLYLRQREMPSTDHYPVLHTLEHLCQHPTYQEELKDGKLFCDDEIELARQAIRNFSKAHPHLASRYTPDDRYWSYGRDEIPVPHPDVLNAYINRGNCP